MGSCRDFLNTLSWFVLGKLFRQNAKILLGTGLGITDSGHSQSTGLLVLEAFILLLEGDRAVSTTLHLEITSGDGDMIRILLREALRLASELVADI